MEYFSPVRGVELETKTFSKTVEFDAGPMQSILSPVKGVAEVSPSNNNITIKGEDGSKLIFDKVGRSSVTNGSRVNIGSQIGYTSDDALELTVYDRKGSKVDVKNYLTAGLPTIPKGEDDYGKEKGSSFKSYSPTGGKKVTDYALVKGIGQALTAPFQVIKTLTGGKLQKESDEETEKILKEQVDRIKQLMK
jgi:hypothetical protein